MIGRPLAVAACTAVFALFLGQTVAAASLKKACWNAATRQDESEVFQHCGPLAEAGDPHAQYLIGTLHQYGKAGSLNLKEAVNWYRLSAEQGYVLAQYALGLCYLDGNGIKKDVVQAYSWVALAAAQGDEDAIRTKGIIEKQMKPADIFEAEKLIRTWTAN